MCDKPYVGLEPTASEYLVEVQCSTIELARHC